MIKVKVEKKDTNYTKISVLGHAMYEDYGKDIVCSAVSSIVITTINGIISLNKDSLNYRISKKGMTIIVNSNDRITQVLINNMINLLKELENDYKDFIQIN